MQNHLWTYQCESPSYQVILHMTTHCDLSLKVHGLHYHVCNVSNGDLILLPNCKV